VILHKNPQVGKLPRRSLFTGSYPIRYTTVCFKQVPQRATLVVIFRPVASLARVAFACPCEAPSLVVMQSAQTAALVIIATSFELSMASPGEIRANARVTGVSTPASVNQAGWGGGAVTVSLRAALRAESLWAAPHLL
jgi:hypothetical protein